MKRTSVGVVLLLVSMAFLAGACGGDSPTGPSNQPYTETVSGTVSVFGTTRHSLNIPRAGNMRLTLNWVGNTDLDLYLTVAACQQLYPKASCGILLTSDSLVGTQETVSRTVNAGDTYAIFVDNLSTTSANTYTISIRID